MIAVTKLIDLLNKPALLYWSNKLGLKGESLSSYYKKTQKEGNDNHDNVEMFIKHGTPFPGCEKLTESLLGYEIIGTEVDVSNGSLLGRIDLILAKNEKTFVLDYKRNKNIYLGTKLQLSAYKHLYGADEIAYINSDDLKIEIINIDTEKYWKILKNLYVIHLTLKEIGESL